MNINFTDYFSDLLVLETQDPNPKYPEELDPQNFEEALTQYKILHKKYVQLLERHNLLRELIANGRYHPHQKNVSIQLSDKEKLILQLICSEYTSKEIVDQLNMSLRTIGAYRQSLQEKTGSKNSAGLILYAIRNGIVALKAS